MLVSFFLTLRQLNLPVSLKEYLDLLRGLEKHLAFGSVDQFYWLSRAIMIKDEKHYDKFDRAFAAYFKGLEELDALLADLIPEDWLRKEFERSLSEEDKAKLDSLGGLDELIKAFEERLNEQKERHAGGNKWIGTGGTSPFGAYGYHPEGIRIGQDKNRQGKAAKVWDQRAFKNLDDDVELGTRSIKVALKRLRKFARTGADEELDLPDTIRSTAHNGGLLDIKLVPERRNAVKILLFFDVGGSMDPYIRICEELFSAASSEFKHMEYFYFHNCIYESVWKDNIRRMKERTNTWDILHKYASDYHIIFVGDASMGPYEISHPGGSVEHYNDEAGHVWMQRFAQTYNKIIWLNPVAEDHWRYSASIEMMYKLVDGHMYPLTLNGLENAMQYLSK